MIYLDNNATTALDPAVRDAMLPYLGDAYGNPSSIHRFGQQAHQAIENARVQLAALLDCDAKDLCFTSGGTESDNAAIFGTLAASPPPATTPASSAKPRILTTSVEHSAVREPLAWLSNRGCDVVEIPVDTLGHLDLAQLETELQKGGGGVALVSIMWANNETGVIFDIPAIAALARRHGAVFHCDAVQAAGKIPLRLRDLPIDLLSLSAHKFHGPKGVGALYVRRGLRWAPFIHGGPQERERRGGTENVPGIVGLGAAAQLAASNMPAWTHVAALRDRLEQGLVQRIPDTHINGDRAARVPNTTNIGFAGVQAEAVLLLLSEQDVCASAGAACASGSLEPSPVLRAMHLPDRIAHGAVRFSLSHLTTQEEIDRTLDILPPIIARLRAVM